MTNNLKAGDLMIGNYLHDNKGNLCRVEKIEKDSFYAPVIEGALTHLPNHPIPLTPAILERCGFVKFRDNQDSGFTAYRLIFGTKFNISIYFELGKKADTEINNTEIDCTTLHQLQNLANVLGVKLNLTPPK